MKYEIIIYDPAGHYFKAQPINEWLITNVSSWEWDYLRPENAWKFIFKNEEDKVKFILRWL